VRERPSRASPAPASRRSDGVAVCMCALGTVARRLWGGGRWGGGKRSWSEVREESPHGGMTGMVRASQHSLRLVPTPVPLLCGIRDLE
jgi:hypothetical protein